MPTLNRRHNSPTTQGRNNRKIYQSYRWHAYSRAYLKRNRLCVQCLKEGKTVVSQCTDHIVPLQIGGSIWDLNNHQALCLRCHNTKTANERRINKR